MVTANGLAAGSSTGFKQVNAMTLVINVLNHTGQRSDTATVVLGGRMNDECAHKLSEQIDRVVDETVRLLAFDLRHLSYINSAGVRAVFKGVAKVKENNGRCGVVHLQPQIRKVFDIIRALPDMSIFKNDQEFDEYLDCMQAKAC